MVEGHIHANIIIWYTWSIFTLSYVLSVLFWLLGTDVLPVKLNASATFPGDVKSTILTRLVSKELKLNGLPGIGWPEYSTANWCAPISKGVNSTFCLVLPSTTTKVLACTLPVGPGNKKKCYWRQVGKHKWYLIHNKNVIKT